MSSYSKDEWQRLIEQYNRELLATYAASPQSSPSVQADPSHTEDAPSDETFPAEPSRSNETISEEDPVHSSLGTLTDSELTDIGRLQVRVSTENQAIPIEGAVVTVTRQNGNDTTLVRTMATDNSGLTAIIDLPTKDRALSLVPGNIAPYATYTIDVTSEGYFQKRFTDLPIYGGVTAIQSVSMIPLPEAGDTDAVLIYPQNGGPSQL